MEYVVSAAIVAIFVIIFFLTRPKVRPIFYDFYDELYFTTAAEEYVKGLPLPKEGSKNEIKKYASSIKSVIRKLKMRRYGDFFEKFFDFEDEIKTLLKTDFTKLDSLPSVNGEPRAVSIARFCLAHSDYVFDESRVKCVLDAQNRLRTLSFCEIEAMRIAFICVLIEKLSYVYKQLDTLARVHTLAAKYVYNPVLLSGKYKKLAKSRLFLSICAVNAGYRMEYFGKLHADVIDSFASLIKNILATVKLISEYDFSRYYTPLEILDKFEVFSEASPATKNAFLNLVREASDKENLDEFMYVIRLEKYMRSASAGHMNVNKLNLLSRSFFIINQNRDITMLAAALSSRHFMNLYFTPNIRKKRGKSIAKMVEYENTYEPIYKFYTVNFGISTSGGKLRISPNLPRQIESADVVFSAYGVENSLHIRRGDEKALYLGATKISGVEQIKLGDKPLDITVKIPSDSDSAHNGI